MKSKVSVTVLPISWFENSYQVKLSRQDASSKEVERSENVIFWNIKKVLNPNIIEPPLNYFAKQFKING